MDTNNKKYIQEFKTNIRCGGCVARVAPFLEQVDGISEWKVDTTGKDKILSVISEDVSATDVIKKIEEAGFRIEKINQ